MRLLLAAAVSEAASVDRKSCDDTTRDSSIGRIIGPFQKTLEHTNDGGVLAFIPSDESICS